MPELSNTKCREPGLTLPVVESGVLIRYTRAVRGRVMAGDAGNRNYMDIKRRVESFIRNYYSPDEFLQRNIRLKEEHTYRVAEESVRLAEHEGYDDHRKALVSIIALLHDIARFPQMALYRTFMDRETRDHGDWGCDIILAEGILDDLPREDRTRILTAVRLHNKFTLPDGLDDETLLYCRVIRDADKIDIFHVVSSMNVTEQGVSDEPPVPADGDYNPQLVRNLLGNINADYRQVHSRTDLYLLQLSWIYSLNFLYTARVISERGYLEGLMAKLPEDSVLNEVREHIRTFLGDPVSRIR